MKSSNEYDEDSTLVPLISEEEMDAMSSGDEYDIGPMLLISFLLHSITYKLYIINQITRRHQETLAKGNYEGD